mgnify:CR=1 FL=1
MSLIYTKLTSIVNKISQLFHESLLFTIIFSILNYFENAWVNSYLKGLYPGENFLGFIKKNKIKTTSKRPFPTGGGLFSGAVTALQLPFFWKDFHNKNNKNRYV